MDIFYDVTDSAQKLKEHGILGVEMEASALYSLAMRKGRKALGIMTVSDHIFTHEAMDSHTREQKLVSMVEVGLAALSQG